MNAHTPVAKFVAKPFDDDGLVVGNHAGCLGLFGQVADDVPRSVRVEEVVFCEFRQCRVEWQFTDSTVEFADGTSEFDGSADLVAVPERHFRGLTRRGCDDHFLKSDVFDAPRRCAEQKRLTGTAFIDHLFVQLADSRAVGQEHAVQAPVGNGSRIGDRKSLRPVAGTDRVGNAVPHDARAQFVELGAGITPGEEVENVVEDLVGYLGEVRTSSDDLGDGCHGCLAQCCDMGHDLLGKHVERIAQVTRRFDVAVDHPTGDHGGFDEVSPVLGKHLAPARFADRVTGAPHALQTPAHGAGRLDLNDEVDCSHVDTEFETRCRDDAAQLSTLQLVFDEDALLTGQRPVVRLHEVVVHSGGERKFIEVCRKTFGLSARVAEDDRAAVRHHLFEDLWVQAGPDTRSTWRQSRRGRPTRQLGCRLPEITHVLDGNDHLEVERFSHAGIDDCNRPRIAADVSTEEACGLFEWLLCCRQSDALGFAILRSLRDFAQTFEAEHQVSSALRAGKSMNFVDDHRVDVGESLACLRSEHEEQTLGRRDEQVGRATQHRLTFAGRRVTRSQADGDFVERLAYSFRREADTDERCAQVFFDVEGKSAQR